MCASKLEGYVFALAFSRTPNGTMTMNEGRGEGPRTKQQGERTRTKEEEQATRRRSTLEEGSKNKEQGTGTKG